MKKTVIFEFPDNFKFPKYFDEENTFRIGETKSSMTGEIFFRQEYPESACGYCPFQILGGEEELYCMLTGDDEFSAVEKRKPCPFYNGTDVVNYEKPD